MRANGRFLLATATATLAPSTSLLSCFNATPLNTLHCLFTRNKTRTRQFQYRTPNSDGRLQTAKKPGQARHLSTHCKPQKAHSREFKATHASKQPPSRTSSLKDKLHKKGLSAEVSRVMEKMQRSMEEWGNSTRRLEAEVDELERLLDSMKRGSKTVEDMLAKMRADVDDLFCLIDRHDALISASALSLRGNNGSMSSIANRAHAEKSIQRATSMTEGIDNSNNTTESMSHSDEQPRSDTAATHGQSMPSSDTKSTTALSRSPTLPPSTTTLPLLPITDLVTDLPTTSAPSLDLTSLQTSKHHPDFRIRNQPKMLRLATILSDLQLHLSVAHRNEDQATLNAMHARITAAGEGLGSLAVAMPAEKKEGVRRLSGGKLWEIEGMVQKKEREWYGVQHGCVVEEGGEHGGLSLGRVKRAREVWEAKLSNGEGGVEVEAESEAGVEAESEGERQDESEETTLVDGVEELPLLRPTISAALD